MESKFIFFFLASKVKKRFFCRSDLFRLNNTTEYYMCLHKFFKNITVAGKNAEMVVFSPPSFHLFDKKKRKMEGKKEKNEKIAFEEKNNSGREKNRIH